MILIISQHDNFEIVKIIEMLETTSFGIKLNIYFQQFWNFNQELSRMYQLWRSWRYQIRPLPPKIFQTPTN